MPNLLSQILSGIFIVFITVEIFIITTVFVFLIAYVIDTDKTMNAVKKQLDKHLEDLTED